jgi:hypothetical protein
MVTLPSIIPAAMKRWCSFVSSGVFSTHPTLPSNRREGKSKPKNYLAKLAFPLSNLERGTEGE